MNNLETDQKVAIPEPKNGIGGIFEKVKASAAKIWVFVPVPVKGVVTKFYSNKKIFWPVSVAVGLVFLIIILGLLFGSKTAPVVIPPKKTPAPFVLQTPTASPSGDLLTVTENKLKDLNNQINALDVSQSRLKPPDVDYDVSF